MSRRYRYDTELKQVVEVTADYDDAPRRAPVATEGITYSNLQATDGTPLDSRKKHREYMHHHGLALTTDFTETWKQAEKQRDRTRTGDFDHQGRKEAIARALEKGRKR